MQQLKFRILIYLPFKVLPLVREHLSITRQQELLHQSLCVMPLKLIERVLPWLVKSLTANEAKNFVSNMQLTGSILFPSIHKYYFTNFMIIVLVSYNIV